MDMGGRNGGKRWLPSPSFFTSISLTSFIEIPEVIFLVLQLVESQLQKIHLELITPSKFYRYPSLFHKVSRE